jgi:hypothetical protein
MQGEDGRDAKGLKNKLKGKGKEEVPVVESANIWMIKIMARLYQHMEVLREGTWLGVIMLTSRTTHD